MLLFSFFITACSRSGSAPSVDKSAAASPTISSASRDATGSGKPAASAIDDAAAAQVESKSPLPPPTGFVNDYAKVIDARTKKDLETTLGKLKEDTKIEFAVVTVDTTGDQAAPDYAQAVARGWGIGPKDESGGGLILLIAIRDRKWAIRWSKSLMSDLDNGTEDELQSQMTEPFRQGKYSEGIINGVNAVMQKLAHRRHDSP
jgi:uncharacterized protein